MKAKYNQFKEAIIKANKAAIEASKPEDDWGTCNLDSVVIDFTGWRSTAIEKLSEDTGVRISYKLSSWMWKGCCFISFPADGMANNRTRMVEAAYKSLKEFGIEEARMYYQMD